MKKWSILFPSMLTLLLVICFGMRVEAGPGIRDTASIDKLYSKAKMFFNSNSDSAVYYLQQVEVFSIQLKYERGTAYALYGRGVTEKVLYKQFEYFTRSLEIFDRLHEKFGMGINLVKIGDIYFQIGRTDKALEYFKRSLEVKKEIKDYGGIALTLIDMGRLVKSHGDLERALKYFEEALFYRIKDGKRQGIAYAQVNMGEVFYDLHKMTQALAMADSAAQNFSFASDTRGLLWSWYLKGKSLVALGRGEEAENIFEQICSHPSRLDFGHTVSAKGELIRIYSSRGDIKRAFKLQTEYLVAKDRQAKLDYRSETQRLANEYEFRMSEQKVEREKAILGQQTARRFNLENLSIAILVLLMFVILISGRKTFSSRVVEGFLMVVFLLFFEFLLVLTDSSVERMTGGEPVLKLLANVVLALLIMPGHHFLEQYTRKRLLTGTINGH